MADHGNRTLVCSVLFIDIVRYSKTGVAEQVKLKQVFNEVLTSALAEVPSRERVLVDTGDGAAVTFLGDPQDALFVALAVLDKVGELPLRLGINLGPVSLMKDMNGLDNVVGDGINVAERVMSFAAQGQVLVSRSFFEVMSLLSKDYGALFKPAASRTDKHGRAHELYAVTAAIRAAPVLDDDTPAQAFDAGTHFIVSARSQARVQEAVKKLGEQGCKLISPMTQVGAKWVASLDNPKLAVPATVEALGFKRVITGPTFEAVQLKLQDLLERGAVLVQDAELADGVWTAVCENT